VQPAPRDATTSGTIFLPPCEPSIPASPWEFASSMWQAPGLVGVVAAGAAEEATAATANVKIKDVVAISFLMSTFLSGCWLLRTYGARGVV
jgi:hypothetical protein